MAYEDAVQDAAESLVHHWDCLDAGDGGVEEFKWAMFKAESVATDYREPFGKVWGDVKQAAERMYAEEV